MGIAVGVGVSPVFGRQNAPYIAFGGDFDGSNDYLLRGGDLTGAADGKEGTISAWVRIDGGNGSLIRVMSSTSSAIALNRNSGNDFVFLGKNTSATVILQLLSNTSYTASAAWLHLLGSWDLANGLGHLYISDADDLNAGPTLTDDTIDYTTGEFSIGSVGGVGKWNGCISELWFDLNYLDITVEANRRKFISAAGKPVLLGADGSLPTGSQPIGYWNNPFGSFEKNKGTGGDLTVTGALSECSTSPSD